MAGGRILLEDGAYLLTEVSDNLVTEDFSVDPSLVAGAGAFAITGTAATLAYTTQKVLAAGSGSFVIVGAAAALVFSRVGSNIPVTGFPIIDAYLAGAVQVSPSAAGRHIVFNLFIGNSNRVEVQGLRNGITGEFLNDAAATFSVYRDGVAISDGSNIAMDYVAGSNGRYVGVLPETADLTTASHTVIITVDAGANADALWTMRIKPSLRAA